MKNKISKEVLDQCIYDLGWQKALIKLELSELQAENILFKKVPKEREAKEKVVKERIIDLDKANIIWSVLAKNYKKLWKLYNYRTDIINVINVRSESTEDKFHNAIIKLVETLERFNYIDDETTLEYIKSRLFFEKKADNTNDYRLNKKISFIDDPDKYLNSILNDND